MWCLVSHVRSLPLLLCPSLCLVCIQVPKLLSMEPKKGSRAGGTRVIIVGEHLNIGSEVRVKVNNTEECVITEWVLDFPLSKPHTTLFIWGKSRSSLDLGWQDIMGKLEALSRALCPCINSFYNPDTGRCKCVDLMIRCLNCASLLFLHLLNTSSP